MSTKYEKLSLSVEQGVFFTNKEMARLEAEIAKVTQKCDASMAKAEQLSLKVLCVPGLEEDAKKLRVRESALKMPRTPRF